VPLTLTVPPGTRLAGVSGARCSTAATRADCTIAAVRPGSPVRITAHVEVGSAAGRRPPIVARVTSTRLDPTQRDNTSVLRLPTRRS